jgi:hypothetical protein
MIDLDGVGVITGIAFGDGFRAFLRRRGGHCRGRKPELVLTIQKPENVLATCS